MTAPVIEYPADSRGNTNPIHHPDDPNFVAIRFKRLQPFNIKCGENVYSFSIRYNINMAWIRTEDVPCLLAVKAGCCGNKKPGAMIYALEHDVPRWNGERSR